MAEKTVFQKVLDGLANLMTGSGTSVDRRMYARWQSPSGISAMEIEAAYRGSWLMRKIIDLPAYDMTRAWRDWQAEDEQIEAIEADERRLGVREKVMQAIILGRLGGGALIMGVGNDAPADELDPERVSKGGLSYLFAASRYQLTLGDPIAEMADPNFGEPSSFKLTTDTNPEGIEIHRSRVIPFRGKFTGRLSKLGTDYWGDSEVIAINEAVMNAETACNEFASLISEAKLDVLKMPDLMANANNLEYEKRFMRRVELANTGKSIHRMLIIDEKEEWEQRQLELTGMPDVIRTFMALVAGAADIPATRLLGKAPDGMNATGQGDQDNYDQMVRTKQENELRPKLDMLDAVLVRSALGAFPEEVYYEFSPLTVMGESAQAEVESKEATTLKALVDTGLFQDEALEEAFSNRMVESGRWPGYDKARADALKKAEDEPTEADLLSVERPPRPGEEAGSTVSARPSGAVPADA